MITASDAMRKAAGLPVQCAVAQAISENISDQDFLSTGPVGAFAPHASSESSTARGASATTFGLLRERAIVLPQIVARPAVAVWQGSMPHQRNRSLANTEAEPSRRLAVASWK